MPTMCEMIVAAHFIWKYGIIGPGFIKFNARRKSEFKALLQMMKLRQLRRDK
jgi:hypothetical protein